MSRNSILALMMGVIALTGTLAVDPVPAAAAPKPATLRVLVTDDDGVAAPGIDALVQGLRKLDRVQVTVVAPADNKSGTSDMTTPGTLTTAQTTTASGYPAIAVQGFPADTVNFALDGGIPTKPQLVASGVNAGANLGPVTGVSGTVGAARTAVRRGVPAVAISQGTTEGVETDYPAGVRQAVAWVKEHRKALTKKHPKPPTDAANINVPTCSTGKVRGVVDVPTATGGDVTQPPNCASKVKNPPDDIVAFVNGYAALSPVPPG
ncbi:MAG: 5'/3'-nucleotidase SurE [Acidimicrobiia bacterium]